jgi:hypothetical protein
MHFVKNLLTGTKENLPEKRVRAGLWLISMFGLVSSMLLSHTAWSTVRTYPLIPIIQGFTASEVTQSALFILVVGMLLSGVFYTNLRRYLTTVALAALTLLVLLDITRLQPWVLHYVAILLLFSYIIPRKYVTTTQLLDAARIIVGGIYFWSGLQKINVRFFTEVFPWFTEALWKPFGDVGFTVIASIGLLVPIIEMSFAVGLFSKRLRTLSLVGSAVMLILVLSSIGPTGHAWNSSVWPWNIAIFGMVFILFAPLQTSLITFVRRQKTNIVAWAMFAVFWLMPIGSLFGMTDHYLSWSLYSGRVPEATLIGDQKILESISPAAAEGSVSFQRWAIADINIVPYPEERVFISVFEAICSDPAFVELELQIRTPRLLQSHIQEEQFITCI